MMKRSGGGARPPPHQDVEMTNLVTPQSTPEQQQAKEEEEEEEDTFVNQDASISRSQHSPSLYHPPAPPMMGSSSFRPQKMVLVMIFSCFLLATMVSFTMRYATLSSKHAKQQQQQQQMHDKLEYPIEWCQQHHQNNNQNYTKHSNPPKSNNDEPNPPPWPNSVKMFHPSQSSQDILNAIAETQDPTMTEIPELYRNNNNTTTTTDPTKNQPITTYTSANHFTTQRWALLFHPGLYKNIHFEVGYYVQVLGLGSHPTDVAFHNGTGPHVPSLDRTTVHVNDHGAWGLGLDTFWRSAENFYTEPPEKVMQWVVSQAAPLRRVHINASLHVSYGEAYVSGGLLANAIVEGDLDLGGQQQWLHRNVQFQGKIHGGAWSNVYVGCIHAPPAFPGDEERPAVTVVDTPRVRVEKPYIAVAQDGTRFQLRIPRPTWGIHAVGPDFNPNHDEVRDFSRVKLARPDLDDTTSLQRALSQGKDLVLSPGIYNLTTSLVISYAHQVVLGLGFATLVAPTDGSPCIRVLPQLPGVRIAGLMLEASTQERSQKYYNSSTRDACDGVATLLEWGYPHLKHDNDKDNDENEDDDTGSKFHPGVLSDVFARVGGLTPSRSVSTDVMMRIHSSHVVGDNLWLWRADHVALFEKEAPNFPLHPPPPPAPQGDSRLPNISNRYHQVTQHECKCATGLMVHGHDVTIHGLAVEHTEETQVIWSGERGEVNFYQCELPYDVTHASFGGEKGFVGYQVEEHVKEHTARGVGVYSNFRDFEVLVKEAVRVPRGTSRSSSSRRRRRKKGVVLENVYTVKLDNYGGIQSVVNGMGGEAVVQGRPVRVPHLG